MIMGVGGICGIGMIAVIQSTPRQVPNVADLLVGVGVAVVVVRRVLAVQLVTAGAASTALRFRTPCVMPPVTLPGECGVQHSSGTASTARVSLARWLAVSRKAGPRALKNSPGCPPPAGPSAAGSSLRSC